MLFGGFLICKSKQKQPRGGSTMFYLPTELFVFCQDMIFFSTPIWNQPMRFLNEQTSVGGLNHVGAGRLVDVFGVINLNESKGFTKDATKKTFFVFI